LVSEQNVIFENIPVSLRERPQWVAWRSEERDGRPTKIPYVAGTERRASATDPATWTSFDRAWQAFQEGGYSGIGYVFGNGDGFCGVDLDHSVDPATGQLKPWAQEIVERLHSYVEISPSGHGAKVFLKAAKPGTRCRTKCGDGEIEIYGTARFFTVTGRRLESSPCDLEPRQEELVTVYENVFGKEQATTTAPAAPRDEVQPNVPVHIDDEMIIRLASSSKRRDGKGDKFATLWNGQWNQYFNSASEADSSVVFTMAFYTKDVMQIDRLFRQSKLYREKWDEMHGGQTYGQLTIAKALSKVTAQYRPRRRRPATASHPHGREAVLSSAGVSSGLPEVFLPGGPSPILEAADQLGRLLAATGRYFIRGGTTVTLGSDDDDRPILVPVKPAALASRFETVAKLKEFAKDHGQFIEVEAICTEQDAKLIQQAAPFQEAMPPIRLLSQCPVLVERDGNLIQVSGYDRASGIMAFGEPALEVPLEEAVPLLVDLLVDFRFASPADRARALAALVTPGLVFGRLLKGRAPIDLGEADLSQTGKGYRNRLGTAIYSSTARMVTQRRGGGVGSMEETFNSALVKGATFISFDNVRGSIDSPAVESFMTEDTYLARVPYQPPVEVDPRRVLVLMTSNRADVTPDLANRACCVRILKQPADYAFHRYPEGDLLDHVVANQPRYLGAVFAVLRAWHDAGKPRTTETRHDFRAWAQTLDWIVRNLFQAGALLDGHRETQIRMSVPVLNWLRDVALAVRQADQMGLWLRASALIDIIADRPGVELPGVPEGADLNDDDVRKKSLQAVGRKLSQCFGGAGERIIDGIRIARRESVDAEGRTVRDYLFAEESLAESSPYGQNAHRGRIGGNVAHGVGAQCGDLAQNGAQERPPYETPYAPAMRPAIELAVSPNPAMKSAKVFSAGGDTGIDSVSPAIKKRMGVHRGIGGIEGESAPVLDAEEVLVI
jgi:hypothetical protein